MENTKRHLELSSKFMEMGQALLKEGNEKQDYVITQSGTFLILISGIMFSDEDVFMFGELCSMFSSKKILDNMAQTDNPLSKFIKKVDENNSYGDFIKRINDLRKGLGDIPEDIQ